MQSTGATEHRGTERDTMAHHFDATIARLIALSTELAAARRWDDVKACQDAAQQLAALRDHDLGHPLFGNDGEHNATAWSALVD